MHIHRMLLTFFTPQDINKCVEQVLNVLPTVSIDYWIKNTLEC